jgi:hypothetical protein
MRAAVYGYPELLDEGQRQIKVFLLENVAAFKDVNEIRVIGHAGIAS